MRGVVTFSAGGVQSKCAFTTTAMVAFEEANDGKPFLSIVEQFDEDGLTELRITFLVELFGYAYRACNPEATDLDLAEVTDLIGPAELIRVIGEAIRAAFPDQEGNAKAANPKRQRKTAAK